MPIDEQQYQKMYGHIRPSSKRKEAIALHLRNNVTSRSDKVDLYCAIYDYDADGDLKTWAQIELETMGFTADSTPDMFSLSSRAPDVPETIGNDGKVYTREAIRDMNLLLFDPKSKAFLAGTGSLSTDWGGPVNVLIIVFIPLFIVLFIITQFLLRAPNTIVPIVLVSITASLVAGVFIFIQQSQSQKKLETQGVLLVGRLVSASGRWIQGSPSQSARTARSSVARNATEPFYVLTIEYTFKTPELQQKKEKKDIQDKRLDLEHLSKSLPGTPTGILYINDNVYRLL